MILTDRPARITGVIASSQLPQSSRPTLFEFAKLRAGQHEPSANEAFSFDMALAFQLSGDDDLRRGSQAAT
jgi:hypothetical protein